ncbi:MAG: hypothetical protein QGG36_03345 [Pirellulaceae bacterium]|nr:hypothetical protein [Pirellulaceae bacterium]MDP7014813.1 hypothetical protein [Pirellulaceae bacterium]
MGLRNLVAIVRGDRKWVICAEQVVDATADTAWELAQSRLPGMSLPEARGYIRARARGEVRRVADELIGGRRNLTNQRARIVSHALDEIVQMTISRQLNTQPARGAMRRAA